MPNDMSDDFSDINDPEDDKQVDTNLGNNGNNNYWSNNVNELLNEDVDIQFGEMVKGSNNQVFINDNGSFLKDFHQNLQ